MTPSAFQVSRFSAELHAKFDRIPGMKARIDRGAALALAGDVCPDKSGYMVLSSANDGTGYPIAAGGRCCCPDSAHGAPVVRGVPACKHNIAYNIFYRALCETLIARILGDGGYPNRRQQRRETNTWLLLLAGHDGTRLWADKIGRLAQVKWSTPLGGWIPATPHDMIAVEEWLEQASEPINTLAETATLDAVARYDEIRTDASAPVMPTPAFGQWLKTGELPAYQQLDQALAH